MAVTKFNPQAVTLNQILEKQNPEVYSLLSERGKAIYFPKDGILGQSADARGKKINATIGIAVNDDGTPTRLSAISDKIKLDPKDVFPYAPSYGKLELREAWLKLLKKKNSSLKGNTSLPVVTNALTHALSIIGYLFTDPGDSIILSDKFWGNYRLIFEYGYDAKLVTFNTFKDQGFDVESFENTLHNSKSEKTIVLFNFPNNPTGYTPTIEESEKLISLIKNEAERGKKILVICDDAYFGLVFKKGVITESLFSYLSTLHKNVLAVKIDGATKEEYVWGLRVGFIIYGGLGVTKKSYSALTDKTAGAIRGNISSASHLSQSLVLNAISNRSYRNEKKYNHNLLKKRFEKVEEVLNNKKYTYCFTPLPYNSGYFMCIKLAQGIDAEKVRQILLKEYDTGVIALGDLLRIAFSSVSEENIPTLFDNIYLACLKIK